MFGFIVIVFITYKRRALYQKKNTKYKTVNIKILSNIQVFGRVSAKRSYYFARDRKNIYKTKTHIYKYTHIGVVVVVLYNMLRRAYITGPEETSSV